MFGKKCLGCKKEVKKSFNFCPWCGHPFGKRHNDFGFLGEDDKIEKINPEPQLPFGVGKILNSLMSQMERELASGNLGNSGFPNGMKIQISTAMPKMQIATPEIKKEFLEYSINEKESERRAKLKKVEAKSFIRRLPEGVVYEIETPGVKSKADVVLTKLEKSLEIKAYSKDKCYIKTIPLKVEILGINVKDDKIFLRLKE
jgi:hypothetical protein